MTLGNLVALTQDNVKRMLAYSSIAHTGYMLVGFAAYAAGQIQGLEGLLFYGAAYTFMNLGAFAVIAALQRRLGVTSNLSTFAGLIRREPGLAILMTLFLLTPHRHPADGRVLRQVLRDPRRGPGRRLADGPRRARGAQRGRAAFYYLRVVVYMFMRDPQGDLPKLEHGRLVWTGLLWPRSSPSGSACSRTSCSASSRTPPRRSPSSRARPLGSRPDRSSQVPFARIPANVRLSGPYAQGDAHPGSGRAGAIRAVSVTCPRGGR